MKQHFLAYFSFAALVLSLSVCPLAIGADGGDDGSDECPPFEVVKKKARFAVYFNENFVPVQVEDLKGVKGRIINVIDQNDPDHTCNPPNKICLLGGRQGCYPAALCP
jgi:hypothetical protein